MVRQAKGITLPIIYKADLKGINDAQSGLQKFGRVAGRIGLAVGAAFAGVVAGGVKMAVDFEKEFNKIEGLVGVTGDELDELREAAKRLGPEMGTSAQEAAEALFFITSAGLRGKDAVDVLEASLKGAAIGLAVGAAFAGVVAGGVKMAADFETEFSKIEGLVGVTGSELDKLREAARRLGPQFGKSGQEAAEALFFITSAGLRGSDAIDVLEASLKGAAIGLGDTKVIADLATSAMNAFGVENLSGAQAVDVLAEAVRLGKLAPEELAGSMGQVLPIASAMGVSFEEVGAVFAAMSRTGTNASQAATQLRGIMTSLL